MVQWLRYLTLEWRVPGSIPGSSLTPLLHLTCGAGVVDDKDLTVSSDQGNAWLFVHLTQGIMGEECCTLNDLPRLNKKLLKNNNNN